jgi:hypothetical protein
MGKAKNTEEQKSHTKVTNPKGHEEDSGLHSHTTSSVYTHEFCHKWTFLKNTKEREKPRVKEKNENGRGEGDWGHPHPIYQGYYTVLVLPLDILSSTTSPEGVMVQLFFFDRTATLPAHICFASTQPL